MSSHITEIIERSRAAFKDGWLQDILKQPDAPFHTLAGLVGLINSSRASHGLEPLPHVEREDGVQAIPVELLYILPEQCDCRAIKAESAARLIHSYKTNLLTVTPFTVEPMLIDGELRLAVRDGFLRYIAMMMAKEQGAKVDFVLVRAMR
ncbi:hypothetical protein JQ760_028310 (plasmid) [Klebsiella pneumoniae]|uniref:hypothetical protein n=1 Tax=Klebsiella pneumoniae TaxID=573 RepID=UPI001FAD99EF|nr:hypothetical protein [Klebsiella pneumoniae]MCI8108433.1 hypothetical protein [Klebsiella pneumoniae]